MAYMKAEALDQLSKMLDGYAQAIDNLESMLTDGALTPEQRTGLEGQMSYACSAWNAVMLASQALMAAPADFGLARTSEDVVLSTAGIAPSDPAN